MPWLKALAVWFLIIALETVHGALRQWLIVPFLGDMPARQLGVFTGSALILLVAWWTASWLGASTRQAQLRVGALWVLLILVFEIGLGFAFGYSWARILSDYDLTQGGLMGFGLLVLLFAPMLGWKLRGRGWRFLR